MNFWERKSIFNQIQHDPHYFCEPSGPGNFAFDEIVKIFIVAIGDSDTNILRIDLGVAVILTVQIKVSEYFQLFFIG